jgi:hypothetical protein
MTVQVKYIKDGQECLADVWFTGKRLQEANNDIKDDLQRRFGVSEYELVKVYPQDGVEEQQEVYYKFLKHQ